MVVVAAALMFGGPRLWSGVLAPGPESGATRGRTLLLVFAHLASFGALVFLTTAVWEGDPGRSPAAPFWILAWLTAALATLGFWLAAMVPFEVWRELVRGGAGALIATLAFGAAAIFAGRLTAGLWRPLSGATFAMVRALLALGFSEVVADPATQVLGTADFQVEIATECGGFEGIGLIWVFLTAYLWLFRRTLRFPRALWLLPVGTVVMWLANASRIALLVTIGTLWSPSVALGGFHSQAGWLAFNAVALGLVAVSRKARFFQNGEEANLASAPASASESPTAAYLGPLLILVGVVMVSQVFGYGTGFDPLYPARVAAVALALWAFRRTDTELSWSWSWQAIGLGGIAFALWMALEPAANPESSTAFALGLNGTARPLALIWLVFRVVGSVVTVPIAEELAFRGYLTRRLISPDFTKVTPGTLNATSLLVSSLLFGALHGRLIAGLIAGAIYALAYHRKGKLADAVVAHATTNALIAAHVLTTGTWSLWL